MFINQLRYIDLKTMKVYFVPTPDITSLKIKAADQSNIITRMAIGDDGNGYALTNDGNHLLHFTTGKKITILIWARSQMILQIKLFPFIIPAAVLAVT